MRLQGREGLTHPGRMVTCARVGRPGDPVEVTDLTALTAQVIGGIHWQALRLWLKRTPVHDHSPLAREST